MATHPIKLSPAGVARALGAVAFLLVLASIGGQLAKYVFGHEHVFGLVHFFYVDDEQNLPTVFSVLLLFSAALHLTVVTLLKKKQSDPDVTKWAVLAFGFLYMAVDEASSLHEKLIKPVRYLLGDGPKGIFYFAWVIPGIAVVSVLTLFFVSFLWRLPAQTRFRFVVAAALYVGGAIGVELVGGRYAELHGRENFAYSMIVTLEEGLEMAGVIVFIYAVLKYLADNYKEVQFRLDNFEANSRSTSPET